MAPNSMVVEKYRITYNNIPSYYTASILADNGILQVLYCIFRHRLLIVFGSLDQRAEQYISEFTLHERSITQLQYRGLV